MVRIVGYMLNVDKQVYISLSSIYGIGFYSAKKICLYLGIDSKKRTKTLTDKEIKSLNEYINSNCITGDDLKKHKLDIVQDYIKCGSRRGKRLLNGLPSNGQNSKSNAKTARKKLHI